MANPWFRLYAEFSHDPKVQMMSEVMQRRYIMLMCMRCSNVTVTLHVTEIAFYLRITDAELTETKALFLSKGFIDDDWNLLNWEKRQFISDSSAERVSRHREKKKQECNANVTLQKQECNALDTDTDTDINTLSVKPDFTSQSREVIDYLNAKTDRNFEYADANIRLITARLKESGLNRVMAVVDAKVSEWLGDERFDKYLRPSTLFNATKFASYAGVIGSSKPAWER